MCKVIFLFASLMFSVSVYADQAIPLSIMTFNIENGGTQVDFNKVVEAIKQSKADVVGIQEAWGNTERLAKALHWSYYRPDQQIISRFPLHVPLNADDKYLFVEVAPKRVVAVANWHLPDEPYGPTLVESGASLSVVLSNERKVRLPVALPVLQSLSVLANRGMPVFITGDFNSPSDLDWTAPTVNVLRNHRYTVAWPVTHLASKMGFKDSYRFKHPDPVATPGYTWPSGRPMLAKSVDGFNPSANDLPDRLDMILMNGSARVTESQIIGEANNQQVDINITPWPSDHRAVVSRFLVNPVPMPVDIFAKSAHAQGTSAIRIAQSVIAVGKPWLISWRNAPGNRYDYIQITPDHATKTGWGDVTRLYTDAQVNGHVQYDANNVKGNRLLWNACQTAHWPLAPGFYNIQLKSDDSNTTLASTRVQVIHGDALAASP